ncbi:hmp, partial [Acrasis kona]
NKYKMKALLTLKQTNIIKATVPVLAEHGVTITKHFYKRMLTAHPELKSVFNQAHQITGHQPEALAKAVHAYASNIDNLGALKGAVERISNKHASLNILPSQYDIVGKHLLLSIKEVVGDAATDDVIDAWAAAYGQLAQIMINKEEELMKTSELKEGGWRGWRKFKVQHTEKESDEITSFYLVPVDGGAVPEFISGQYISVKKFIPALGFEQPRQYTLSDAPNKKYFRVSVKREDSGSVKGVMSNELHQVLTPGVEIDVSCPYGVFVLDHDKETPVVLMSGGVGLTPMISMLTSLVQSKSKRQIRFVHGCRDGKVHAMKDYLNKIVEQHQNVEKVVFYDKVNESDVRGRDYDYEGFININNIKDKVILPDADYYLCGPPLFMLAQSKVLEANGVDPKNIHTEMFGSA